MEIQMNIKYQRRRELQGNSTEDTTILSDNVENKYYGLNVVGSNIWSLLENPISPNEIVIKLRSIFSVDEETCKKEVSTFLQELLKENIISVY